MLQPHIKCKQGDVAKYVLLPGDPERARKVAQFFDEPKEIANNREFLTITGKYKNIPVSVTSTGIGCPGAAIAVEELANIGAETLIRIGTCGGLKEEIGFGDIIIPYAATRSEGTTREYLPIDFPAMANTDVFQSLKNAAKKMNIKHFCGVNRTHDAFYENISNFLRWADIYKDKRFKSENIPLVSSEMECSCVFLVSMVRGIRAGALMAVNTTEPLDKIAENPDLIYHLEESKGAHDGIENTIKIALEAIVELENSEKR